MRTALKANRPAILWTVLGLMIGGNLPAMATDSLKPPEKKFMTVATGTIYSVYNPIGSAICQLINRQSSKHNIYCSVRRSSGSAMNLERLQRKTVDFAIVQSDQAKQAIDGTFRIGEFPAFPDIRGVMSLYPEQFVVVSRKGSGIERFLDFKGKVIDAGEDGSGTAALFELIRSSYGIEQNFFQSVTHLAGKTVVDNFCHGSIDGFAYLSGSPNSLVQSAIENCNGQLVLIDSGVRGYMATRYPELIESVIPPGRYPGVNYEVPTIGSGALLVTSTQVDPQIVQAVVQSVADQLGELHASHPVMSDVTLGDLLPKFKFLTVVDASKKVFHD